MDLQELAVCVDCINYIANADLPDERTELTAKLIITSCYGVMYDGKDLGFSYQRCDCCKRKLGGDRFRAYKRID